MPPAAIQEKSEISRKNRVGNFSENTLLFFWFSGKITGSFIF